MQEVLPSTLNMLQRIFDEETIRLALSLAREEVNLKIEYFVDNGNELYGQLISNSLILASTCIHFKELPSIVCCIECSCIKGGACQHSALTLGSYLDSLYFDRLHSLAFGSLGATCSRRSISGRDVVGDSSEESQELSCSPILPGMIAMGHTAEQTYSNLSFAFEKLREAEAGRFDTSKSGNARSVASIDGITIDNEKLIYVVETRKRRISTPDLTAFAVRVHRNGRLGRKRAISFGEVETLAARSDLALDYAIGSLKRGIEQWEFNRAYSSHEYPDDYHDVFKLLMTRILKTGRCFWGCRDGPLLQLGRQLPGRFQWQEISRDTYKLALVAVDAKRTIAVMPWCCPWYRDAYTGRFGPVDIPGAEFLHSRVLELNPLDGRDASAFAVRLARSGLSKYISLPPSPSPKIELKLVDRKPVLNTCFLPTLPGSIASEHLDDGTCHGLRFSYPSMALTDRIYYDRSGRKIIEVQDRADKDVQLQMIRDLGFVEVTDKVDGVGEDVHLFLASSSDSWDELNEHALACLSDGGIDIEEGFSKTIKPVVLDEGDITFEVDESSGLSWWFSLVAFINVGDRKIPLMPVVKSALDKLPVISQQSVDALNRDGRFYASLEDGTRISMPFARIKAILEALQELLSDHGMGMSAVQAANLFLDEGLDRAVWLNADKLKQTALILKELCELEGKAPPVVPDIFNGKLRPYQLIALQWLQILSAAGMGGILADDMGLGKTIQLIAHICKEKVAGRLEGEPFLVICPTSVVPNWLSEVRNFAPSLSIHVHSGPARSRDKGAFEGVDMVLSSYALLLRDQALFTAVSWSGVALDEAQYIKNPLTKVAKSARDLTARYRFCLTGTPVENHLGELWSLFHFLMPGILGTRRWFNANIRMPVEKFRDYRMLKVLSMRIRPLVLRRTKIEVLPELPEKTEIIKFVDLGPEQLDLYESVRLSCEAEIRAEIESKGIAAAQIVIIKSLLQLRQVCCDPRIVRVEAARSTKESAKLTALMEMVEELIGEGRRMLIFSQFTRMLDIIADELDSRSVSYVELRGATIDRVTPVRRFQDGEVPVFLISLKAGGVGLNLTSADIVIHYDLWWNPAVESQATDRAYRIGQEKPVFVYKLVAYGTIEQKLMVLQAKKRELAQGIYDERGNADTYFSEGDLEHLLAPIGREDE